MEREARTVLILGALGLLGRAAVAHFVARGWTVIGVARRAPDFASPARFVSLDLQDADACRGRAADFAGVTHVVYAALYEKLDLVRGWRDRDQIETNRRMLENAFAALAEARGLRHVTLLQGTKAYGIHVEPVPVPAKERWPRHEHENFYWEQEDWLRERQRRDGSWNFTILRPQAVLGHAVGSPMNIVAAIGAYAAIMRELGGPFAWPGGGRFVTSLTDSSLFAEALEWAGTTPQCGGETYNITNGDVIVWQDLWPSLAAACGVDAGEVAPVSLAETMPQHARVWDSIVARHGLLPYRLDQLLGSSWQFADRTFAQGVAAPPSTVMSTIKAREHGFAACVDSEDALVGWLRRLQRERVLPRA